MLTPADAASRLLERRKVRGDLGAWCERALAPQGHRPAAHHRLLIRELEAVARGETRKLMVLMPPGSAKSTYCSYLFPPWYLAAGGRKVLAASHTIERAEYVSKQVRRYVRENTLPLGFALSTDAVGAWETSNGGEYRAAGVGEAIAGFRGDLGLIDDPVKSREAADSETQQRRVWDWYWGDFYTRLRPGAQQVLIMTRWSEGDLGGRLEETEGDTWRIVRLPAFAEANDLLGRSPGEPLWGDDEYGFGKQLREAHASLSRAGRSRDWSALYQQRPAPAEGSLFQRAWLRREAPPDRDRLRVYGASDYAVTADGGDYTVHVVVGMDPQGRLHLLDLWRAQASADVWVESFCDLVLKWRPLAWAEETGQIKSGVGPFLERRMRERSAFVSRRQFPTRGDKAIRAQSIIGRMALDGLRLRPDAPWIADLEAELLAFPAGKHDDQVDALGLLGQLLDVMATGQAAPEEMPRIDRWRRKQAAGGSWKTV